MSDQDFVEVMSHLRIDYISIAIAYSFGHIQTVC